MLLAAVAMNDAEVEFATTVTEAGRLSSPLLPKQP